MDFANFVSLLDKSAIFFSRADIFEDSFEGSWTKRNFERMTKALKKLTDQAQMTFKIFS